MVVLAKPKIVRAGMIGVGGMARHYIRQILANHDDTQFVATCDPSPHMIELAAETFTAGGAAVPPNEPDLDRFLATYAGQLDAVFISTPHKFHHDIAKACLEAGLDVLLEKPMVMTADEARSLIATRDRTGKHLVVAFQGSLSPEIRQAVAMIKAGEIGELLSISATIWQGWRDFTEAAWRQDPVIAGGGFMFDTGAHMLNTVADLAGQNFTEVAAWLDNRGASVDILGVIIGKLESGALVTMHGCGETIKVCTSDIRVFGTKAILRTGAWGRSLDIHRDGEPDFVPVDLDPGRGTWEQFLLVCNGAIPNPSPPEVGLRMAKLWDAIKESAAQGGKPVQAG
ncbi:MAG: Gfo/Idh/MocA family oxidoreductase [Anaerolineae bacterium]|nr:Gfo/Idh/MocA family oxidoreductase [Anaerolineae bacterium]